MRRRLFVLAFLTAAAAPVFAQSAGSATANWARVQALDAGATIQIATTRQALRSMMVVAVDRTGLTLRDPAAPAAGGTPNYVLKDDVVEIRGMVPARRGSTRGFGIGAAIGGGIGVLAASAPRTSGDNVSAGRAIAAVAVSAAIGGTIGYFSRRTPSRQGVIYARPRTP